MRTSWWIIYGNTDKKFRLHISKNTPFEKRAIYNINIAIPERSYTAIIGHTGSGKSTLLQHLNGLLQPTEGEIQIGDVTITADQKKKD